MNASKPTPSGRTLTKLGISETAWSIGKSLENDSRKLVLGKMNDWAGNVYERFVL